MSQLSSLDLLCCGWKELGMVGTYRGDFNSALKSLDNKAFSINAYERQTNCGALIFTAAGDNVKYGDRFASDIETRGLGKVTKLPVFRNPNTGNKIQAYIWVLNKRALVSYCIKFKIVQNSRRIW